MPTMTDARLVQVLDARERSHLTQLRAAGCSCPVPLMASHYCDQPTSSPRTVDGTRCRLCDTVARYPVATSRSMFEGVYVSHTLYQARMLFATTASRPMYSLEAGGLVRDTSASAEDLRDQLRSAEGAFERAAELVGRAMRVPNTVMRVLTDARTLVMALDSLSYVDSEYVRHYECAMRFLEQYDHTTAVSCAVANAARA